jgi:hypothetical protein
LLQQRGPDASQDVRVDEIRNGHPGGTSNITTTKYSLYIDNGPPGNTADDVLMEAKSFDKRSVDGHEVEQCVQCGDEPTARAQKLRLMCKRLTAPARTVLTARRAAAPSDDGHRMEPAP